jgi:NADPH-dependent ferric siderophore reductase
VRSLDPVAGELSIDFVDHGRPGLTSSWLATLRPGETFVGCTGRAESLTEAVRWLTFEPGVVQAFVHGEGGATQRLRRHLLRERGVPKESSGHWRRGLNDEQWRALKAATAAD